MFRKLRNKFIVLNVAVTSAILLVAFGAIYVTSAVGAERPAEMPPRLEWIEETYVRNDGAAVTELRETFEKQIREERDWHLGRLAVTLITVGIVAELLVFLASYYYAERAIAPVKKAYEQQREFIANASHELKTPIAAIQANFEALDAKEEPWTGNIETELTRANSLVQNLLTLARTDGRTQTQAKKEVDLVKLVRRRTRLIEARLGEKELSLDLPEKAVVKIAEADATQILDILLDNAVKYSDKKIRVAASEKGFAVANDGRKIPADKLERIFDRFYQTDKTAEGSGLGLAIAKAAAGQNGWKIWAESDKKETKFSVEF